ncbi:probable phosphatidylinositol 3,4,5-trisphosphate-dependent Rac exchanger protein at N-terminal half [Coccomyxa sp. Obi]|nr:probable phosphatidylinositol 3,4,5-trisphosphate-dependent Rac exchanger protein at N-terminal half [Coccomyxa sp. Obi]
MSGKQKPLMGTSPFALSRRGSPLMQDGNSNLFASNEPEIEDVAPLSDLHADIGRRLQARRSLSTPDLASLAAEPQHNVERASPSSYQAGTPVSDQGAALGPRRSVSMPDGHYLRMWSNSELISLAERMQQGLHVRDRVYHFKKYPNSFTGADAVRWMLSNGVAGSEGEALLLGNDMLHAGLLHHVKFKRPFQNNGNLYRFLDVRSGASDVTEGNHTGASSTSSQAEAHEFTRFERLYDEMWARRGVQKMDQSVPLLGTQHQGGWSTAAELAQLQRKVADLAAELEEYKALNDLMRDSMTLQLQNGQHLFALLQSRLERAIRRGTWLAVQLQTVWVLLLVLASVLAQHFLSQQPSSFLKSLAQAAVPVLTALCALSALSWQPWQLPAAKKLPEAAPAAAETTVPAATAEESQEAEAAGGRRVDATAEGRDRAEEGAQLCALSRDDAEKLQQPPSEQDFSGWPDEPLLLRAAPLPALGMQQGADPCAIRINDGRRIEFETDLFRGCAVIWAQGLGSSPEGLFAGERRKTSITVQGRFKQDCSVEDIVSGQEFVRQPKNLPAMWLVDKVLIKLAKKISPSMDIGPLSAPYLLAPVLALAQLVNVSRPGEEPDPSQPTPEELRLFDPSLTNDSGGPMDALKRKKHFWNKKNRAGRSFTREHVWTFQMYQHFVDMGAYELNMMYGFDLGRHLDGQPLQFMLKDRRSGDYLMNFHAWHRKLLPAALAAQKHPGGEATEKSPSR